MKGCIINLNEINQYIEPEIDLFIGAISEEDRCPVGLDRLTDLHISIKNKVIFYFNEVLDEPDIESGKPNRDEKIIKFNKLFNISRENEVIFADITKEVDGINSFKHYCEKNFTIGENFKIIIDFSVLVKPYFFILLRYIQVHFKPVRLYLLYTEPASYHQKIPFFSDSMPNTFTKGKIDTCEIPTFSGSKDLSKRNALIILLGFEGTRAIEIINSISPEIVIPINGFPSYRPEFKDISILSNEELLSEKNTFKELRYAPANDPFETYNVLKKFYDKHHDTFNITIAPIGTKPMALGACLFTLEFRDCRVVYPYPQEYILKSSTGFGNSWLYLLEFYDPRKQ